jgi:hypothetical protein
MFRIDESPTFKPARAAAVPVSDTRIPEKDKSDALAAGFLREGRHE